MTKPSTLATVEAACAELAGAGTPVTFTAVAQLANISRPSLYRNPALRAVVEEHRAASNDPRTLSGLSGEIAHLHTAVEALAERVRRHEERLRRIEARSSATRKAN